MTGSQCSRQGRRGSRSGCAEKFVGVRHADAPHPARSRLVVPHAPQARGSRSESTSPEVRPRRGVERHGCRTRRSRSVRRSRAPWCARAPIRPPRPGTSPRTALPRDAHRAGRAVVIVVSRVLPVDPADEPDVDVRVAVELLVEARVGIVLDERTPEVLRRRRAPRPAPTSVARSRSLSAGTRSRSQVARSLTSAGEPVCLIGERASQHLRNRGRHRVSAASRRRAYRCRTRAGRRRTSARTARSHAVRASRPRRTCSDRAPSARRRRVARAARAETARLPPSMAKSDAERRPPLAAEREPGEVRLLHPCWVTGYPVPPRRPLGFHAVARVRVDEDDGCRGLRGRRARTMRRARSESTDDPIETPANPSRTMLGENASSRPPALATRSRAPLDPGLLERMSLRRRRAPRSPRLVWSEITATSISSRSSARSRASRS